MLLEPEADIAVIVTCRNYGRYLGQCLRSIVSQTVKPVTVLVVDDGSTDNTEAVARGFPEVVYHRVEFGNGNQARNFGFSQIATEWVVFFDADNYMAPEFLDTLYRAAQTQPDTDFVYCDRINFAEGDSSWYSAPMGLWQARPFEPALLRLANYVDLASLLRADCFPGFDESLRRYQDWDLWLNVVLKHGGRGHYVQRALFYYRIHESNISRRESGDWAVWYIRRKYRLGFLFFIPLLRDIFWFYRFLRGCKRRVFKQKSER